MNIKLAYEYQAIFKNTFKGRPLTDEAVKVLTLTSVDDIEKFAVCKNCGLIIDSIETATACVNCGNLDFEITNEVK